MFNTNIKSDRLEGTVSDAELQRLLEEADATPFPPTAREVFFELGVVLAAYLALALIVNVIIPRL